MIGSIQSDVLHIKKNTELTEHKIDKVVEGSVRHEQAIKSAHKRLDDHKAHLDDNVAPVLEDYKSMKQKGIGAMAVAGIIFGFIGSLILTAIKYFAH